MMRERDEGEVIFSRPPLEERLRGGGGLSRGFGIQCCGWERQAEGNGRLGRQRNGRVVRREKKETEGAGGRGQ